MAVLSLLGASLLLWFVVPRFAEVFEQVKVPLPAPTVRVAALAEFAREFSIGWGAAMILLPLWLYRRRTRWTGIGLVALGALGLSLLVWIPVVLFLPLIGTLEGVSAGRGRR